MTIEALRRQIEAEVAEHQRLRAVARMLTGTYHMSAPEHAQPDRGSRLARARQDAEREGCIFVMRDPCLRCGVRADRHLQHGCSRWRATQ